IAKMEDVLETYEQPYDSKEPVVCLDEKPITLHADVAPASPAKPGRKARQDNEYERRGTANIFCAVEPKAGRHFTFPTLDRSAFQFAQVAFQLAMQYPQAETIHLVMDNLNIHYTVEWTPLSRPFFAFYLLMSDGFDLCFGTASASKPSLVIPALESALGAPPCGALSSVQVPPV
ncbi:MAG: transposase, partial [Acidobacteriota bacterium]|nr:transposase [Acidobacteriota bacterium]